MTAEPAHAVDIYIDGVCSGNSGPGGWGVLLQYGRHEKELSGGEASATTRGRMALTALVQAFKNVTRPCVAHVYTNSTYLSARVTKSPPGPETRSRSTHLENPVEDIDLWRQLSTVMEPHKVS